MRLKSLSILAALMCASTLLGACGASTQHKNDGTQRPLILDMVHHNPGEPTYQSQYNTPSNIEKMGYNGKVYFLFESPMLAINWESFDKEILPAGTPDREWVDNKAQQIKDMQQECHDAGLTVLAQSDCILFPKRLIEKYDLQGRMGDVLDPEVEKLLRIQIGEMFDQFPMLEGLVTRIGETYLHDAPFHKGAIKDKRDADNTIIPLLSILRDEICVKRGKLLIFRTWMSFDNDLERYQKVSDAVEPHENLVISIKHCEGDFHRGNDFSRVIGEGRHPQIIEVQCAREYEGKGAYPNYVINGVIEGFEEHQDMPADKIKSLREFTERKGELYAGIWTWTRGGGWGGPYIKNEMWCDLNAWVIAQWAADPSQKEEDIFNRYSTEILKLSDEDAIKFRELALLSADAVIRGKTTVQRDMSPWWSRDPGIGYPKFGKDANVDRILAQKIESVEMWEKIVTLSEQITWADEQTKDHAVGSCYYGLYTFKLFHTAVALSIAEDKKNWREVAALINTYDTLMAEYEALPAKYAELATIYEKNYKRHHKIIAEQEIARLREMKEVKNIKIK